MARTKQTARARDRAAHPTGIAYRRYQPLPTKQNRQSNDMSDMSDMSEKNKPVKTTRIHINLNKKPDKRQTKNQKSHMIRLRNHIVIALEPSHFGRSAVISTAPSC